MYSSNKSHVWSLDGGECLAEHYDNITLRNEVYIAIKQEAMDPIDALGRVVKNNIFPLAGNQTRFSGLSADTLVTTSNELPEVNFIIWIIKIHSPEICDTRFLCSETLASETN